jgi:hypothetical protein
MGSDLVYREADLDVCPKKLKHPNKHVSLGDAHGSALKIIYTLIEEGILELKNPDADYARLKKIYDTPTQALTKAQLIEFNQIISNAKTNPGRSITFIGDELADRGKNDYLTLVVFARLNRDKDVDADCLLSNHGMEFLRLYREFIRTNQFPTDSYLAEQACSYSKMLFLINKGLLDKEEVQALIEQSYKPMLKAIDYTLSPEGELSLFTHAVCGLETVKALAEVYGIKYSDKTRKNLIDTIDKINETVQEKLQNDELVMSRRGYPKINTPFNVPLTNPLLRLTWNRVLGDQLITKTEGGLEVNFVHGHVGPYYEGPTSHQNLDNLFGFEQDGLRSSKTGFGLFGEVEHFTRGTTDYTAKQLKEDPKLIYKIEFGLLLKELEETTNRLIAEGESDPKYADAKTAAEALIDLIKNAERSFFANEGPPKPQELKAFTETVTTAIIEAEKVFKLHRSWFAGLDPILKKFLGVLAAPIFFVFSYKARTGYIDTFFGEREPETRSIVELRSYKDKMANFREEDSEEEPNVEGEGPRKI